MLVFLLHGYPNGPYMYKSLIKSLIQQDHIPVVINFRTGVSIYDNVNSFRETLNSYPKDEKKAIVAHDWGAVIVWRLYNELESINVVKLFIMSVSNVIDGSLTPVEHRLYQTILVITKLLPSSISEYIQKTLVGNQYREKQYDTVDSNYSYHPIFAILYLIGDKINILHPETFVQNPNIKLLLLMK